MGLDMWVFRDPERKFEVRTLWVTSVKVHPVIPALRFNPEPLTKVNDHSKLEKLFYWRKHPNLHGWFEKLYREKGGKEEEFNCEFLELTTEDLNNLEIAVKQAKLPFTEGFSLVRLKNSQNR